MKKVFMICFIILVMAAVAVLIYSESVDKRAAELLERTSYIIDEGSK